MNAAAGYVLTTQRLAVRRAVVADGELFLRLWTDPKVMVHVGFPKGLPISLEKIQRQLAEGGSSPFQRLLVVELKATQQAIGECHMHPPNPQGIASTDVKLLPEHWGRKYGLEVKRGLLEYLFTHTDCVAVEATPSVSNLASIRMQEAVGGVRVGEQVSEFPEAMRSYTAPVRHYVYRVSREDWQRRGASEP